MFISNQNYGRLSPEATPEPMPEKPQADPEPKLPLLKRWWAQVAVNGRRIGTVAIVAFTVFLAFNVVTGRNGLTSWSQKRAADKSLTIEIQQLSEENSQLQQHVSRLKSDPGAIEHEARERLHYARPNEIIYALPAAQPAAQPATPAAPQNK